MRHCIIFMFLALIFIEGNAEDSDWDSAFEDFESAAEDFSTEFIINTNPVIRTENKDPDIGNGMHIFEVNIVTNKIGGWLTDFDRMREDMVKNSWTNWPHPWVYFMVNAKVQKIYLYGFNISGSNVVIGQLVVDLKDLVVRPDAESRIKE